MTRKEAIEDIQKNILPVVGGKSLRMAIKALEQPEIIRCKDCAKRKYCRTSTVWAVSPSDDWYCADAERRTDERTD